jgi:glutathione synthase/RimK-type ligase-like ATP-grasp enzyme
MKIIILAQETDNHTAPLKWALEQAGFHVVCWAGLGWSADRQSSIHFEEPTRLVLGEHSVDPGDVVWVRRPEPAQINPRVAPADKKFAEGEYRWFFHSIAYLLETLPVRCINPYSGSRFINNKSVQLVLARRCGLHVPPTLMSNSPAAVRQYVNESHESLICKAFFPHIWQKQAGTQVAVTETFELTPQMLPDDEVLTYAPAIYQKRVLKDFDVRTVLLGTTVYSYSLHNSKDAIDWRQDAGQGLVAVESIATPPEVERALLAFAEKAGIVHGSFDFAVDGQGRWWFLEVNESGQFLWLDEFNRKLRVQEKFLAFLTSPEGSSRQAMEERESLFPSWKNYVDSAAWAEQPPEKAPSEASFVSIEP